MRFRNIAAVIALTLSGCQTVQTQVIAFSRIKPGETRTFSVAGGAGIEGSRYEEMIAEKLNGYGWKQSSSPNALVRFSYSTDGGHQETDYVPVTTIQGGIAPVNATVYSPSGPTSVSGFIQTPLTSTTENVPVSSTVFTRTMRVEIDQKGGNRIYEASARSVGQSSTFYTVGRCIIDAIFKDFPNGDGKAKQVVVSGDKCVVK